MMYDGISVYDMLFVCLSIEYLISNLISTVMYFLISFIYYIHTNLQVPNKYIIYIYTYLHHRIEQWMCGNN